MDNIKRQKRKFELRGLYEKEAIKKVRHVMGRTDWDKACTNQIHPGIEYHCVQEMMRACFYRGSWERSGCEKHRLFMSQGSYPIKGLHLALEAVMILKKQYSDIKLYIAGTDITKAADIKQKLRQTYYSNYIIQLIKKWNLGGNIVFLGSLTDEEMKKQYLKSHVFLSPSVIENSPNSIGEAMLLGVPIVASDVGGVSSLISHKENGFLYPADAPYMLAYYISCLFEDGGLAERLSRNERKKAQSMYDRKDILRRLLEVYSEIKD
ncbi:MAG: glycosyltransferase family 4 protein [Clostridiales bacterium]|nr:glycosyltransferase family 4 protein [Clostridiales bacterium]